MLKKKDGATETSDVIVTTQSGAEYYRWTTGGGWHQYFIADGIQTEQNGTYYVKAMVKASEPVTINVNMGWGWGSNDQVGTQVTIGKEWRVVKWEYSGIGGTSCNLVAQPGMSTAKIEWKWVEVYKGSLPWTDITKGDGRCFYSKVFSENIKEAKFENDAYVVNSPARPESEGGKEWDNQFYIRMPQILEAGKNFKVTFDYKASAATTVATQSQNMAGQYIHWDCIGGVEFTEGWQTFKKVFSVPAQCDGTNHSDGYKKDFRTIAFNLAKEQAIDYYFKNIKIEVDEDDVDSNYYLTGSMNGWSMVGDYKLVANESAEGEYMINMNFDENAEFKIIKGNDWYPGECGNYVITKAGNYTIYFRPDYSGGSDWHCNCIYAVNTLDAAKAALQAAINKVNDLKLTGLAEAIATAQAAVNAPDATIESLKAAGDTFEAAVKAYIKENLAKAIPMVESLEVETLAGVINTAKAALAKEDATSEELANALFGLLEPVRDLIKGVLGETIGVCKPLGIDTSAAETLLSQTEPEATTIELANALLKLSETAVPTIQGVVQNIKEYMTAFASEAATGLAQYFVQLETDVNNGNIIAVKDDISLLMANAQTYLQSDIVKLEGHAKVIGNADITNDVAAMKAAVEAGSFTNLLAAVESFKAHFLAAAPGFVQQIKNAVAGYKAAGKTESIDQVETAILTAEQALGEEDATIVTVGLAVRNLILAFQAYAEANPSYTIAGTKDLTGTEEDWQLVEANNMTKNAETGLYEWTATNIAVSEDNQPQFKVVITDINGNQTWIPASEEGNDHNWVITLGALGSAEEGLYDITITFDATTNEIAVAGVRKSDIPEDIYVKLEESCDIAAAVNAAMVDKNVGAVTIELTKDVAYTFNSTIEVPGALTVWGNDAVIDASALEGNMFQWKAKAAEDTEWTTANVEIAGVKITGLKKALFYSNGKYYVAKNFNINWVNVELAADATTFDFTKGSTAENFTVMNSTFYAPTATTKSFYSSQSGQKTTEWSSSAVQTFKFHNNTMYNLARAKNFFTHRQNSQKWLTFDIQKNIFVNCGKSGQVIKGFNGGGSSANPTWIVKGNAFNFDGADTSADESTGDDAEPIQDSVAGVVTFTDAASGDFNGEFQLAEDATEPENKIGAPAWTITFKEAPHGLIPNGTYYVMSANEGTVINAEGALDAKGAPITFTFNAANNAYTIEGADFFAGKQWTVAEAIEGMSGFYTISTAEGFLAAGEANALEQIADGTADAAVWILLEKAYWEDIVNSTYTVAGTKNLTGTENDWELAEANQMVFNEETGLFEKKFKRIAIDAENQPEFKVVQTNMEGETTWYPTDGNWVITTDYVGGEGLYDITITFDPSDFKEIGVIAEKRIVFPENAIVYDFEAAADAGENPANKNGSAANGQAFYGWENPEKTDSKRQDYKGYEWAEGSVLPEVCHVWRRSDRINGNVAGNGGLKCPSNKEMAIDGLNPGDKVIIVYDAENATDKEIIWAIGDGTSEGGPGAVRATATIGGVEAVSGTTTIASGAEIIVNSVTPAENGTGYIVFQVKKGMIIQQIAVIKAPVVVPEYYLTGTMTSWSVDAAELASYKLVANEEAEGEYMITLDLEAGAEFKAVAIDADNNLTWYPESNCSVNDAGNYTIYFRPAGNTEWEWNYLYANYNGPATGINAVSTAANNAVIFNMAGQRVEKAQKGLYIVNGKKVVLK